jgi:hypothetical protein
MSRHLEFWGNRTREGPEIPSLLDRIVALAVADLLSESRPCPPSARKKARIRWRQREDDRKWAFWWLFTNEDTEPSFRTICEARCCSVEETRERILLFRMAGKIDDRATPFRLRSWAKIVALER